MDASLSSNTISLFLLVLSRVSGLILSAPVIGEAQVPRTVKAALVIAFSALLVGSPVLAHALVPTGLIPFSLAVLAQLVVGIALGLVARTIFFAVQTAGGIVSLQMGLSMGAVLNPLSREPDPILTQLYTVIAALTFLAVHGDVWLLASLARSFDLAPLSVPGLPQGLLSGVVNDAVTVTSLGLQISLPIGVSLLTANMVLGVVSRALPQLNLFMLSMPLGMILGLMAIGGSLAGTILMISHLTNDMPRAMLDLLGKR